METVMAQSNHDARIMSSVWAGMVVVAGLATVGMKARRT
jgi:hypothetical protein